MQKLLPIFILSSLLSCKNKKAKNSNSDINRIPKYEKSAINTKFPLFLDKIKLQDNNNVIDFNDGIVAKINEVVEEYSKDFNFHDNSLTYKDSYINTIRIYDSLFTVFLVLLKKNPTKIINSKVLFYDNKKKVFVEKVFDFNLWALYDFNNGELNPTNLKTNLKIKSAEIDIVDFNKDGINDYKFVRLYHNGTYNAIHTTILTIKNHKVETLHFDEKQIVN